MFGLAKQPDSVFLGTARNERIGHGRLRPFEHSDSVDERECAAQIPSDDEQQPGDDTENQSGRDDRAVGVAGQLHPERPGEHAGSGCHHG